MTGQGLVLGCWGTGKMITICISKIDDAVHTLSCQSALLWSSPSSNACTCHIRQAFWGCCFFFFFNSHSLPEEQSVSSTFFTKNPSLIPGECGLKTKSCRRYTRADLLVTPNGTEADFVLGEMGWSQEPSTALTIHFLLLSRSLFLFKIFGVIYFQLFPFSSTLS